MKLFPNNFYHIYNRGNNSQQIFFSRDNYLMFRNKIIKYILPSCDISCYCLMPNHFHLLIYATDNFNHNKFSQGIRSLLSSYSKTINLIQKRTGSLFQQNTKAKCLSYSKNQNDTNYV